MESESKKERLLRVAFIGNSYIYFNDVPRLFQEMCGGESAVHVQDCLRGGASWASILREGNGMTEKFAVPNAKRADGSYDVGAPTVQDLLAVPDGWNFVVMNTYSQEAAITGPDGRERGFAALAQLAPMLRDAGAVPVLLVTPAYRAHAYGSERLGSWDDFRQKQSEGYELYRNRLAELLATDSPPLKKLKADGDASGKSQQLVPLIADVNAAFALVKTEREELWSELYVDDHIHPSTMGSYLESCSIYCTIFGCEPPDDSALPSQSEILWTRTRRKCVGRFPSRDEMIYLRDVALRVSKTSLLAKL